MTPEQRREAVQHLLQLNAEYVTFGPKLKAMLEMLERPGVDKHQLLADIELLTGAMEAMYARITEGERLLQLNIMPTNSGRPN